jgi:hypothetical protein
MEESSSISKVGGEHPGQADPGRGTELVTEESAEEPSLQRPGEKAEQASEQEWRRFHGEEAITAR